MEGENVSKEEGEKLAEEKEGIFKQTSARMDSGGFEKFVYESIHNIYFWKYNIYYESKEVNK